MLRPALIFLFVVICMSGCNREAAPPKHQDTAAGLTSPASKSSHEKLVATHYFGRQWAKNFINAFRRDEVPGDFRRIREDGFNAVVLVISWGDFQPVFQPCCRYDARAFERLRFLLREAKNAGLKVILRVGYSLSFHPDAGSSQWRIQRLMNDPSVRAAYFAFGDSIAAEIADHEQVVMSFGSWEDLFLYHIEVSATTDYAEFLSTLPPIDPLLAVQKSLEQNGQRFPVNEGASKELFQRYWDWLLIEKFFKPMQARLPNYSFEVRVDKEPLPVAGGATRWLGHERTFVLPNAPALTIYWAPFWGARNEGERLRASESTALLTHLLESLNKFSDVPLFLDQFNFLDNTPGFERNATIRTEELPAFLEQAACVLRNKHVRGYALWTGRDYRESPLFNPAFVYGMDGWILIPAKGSHSALETLPAGDFQLRLAAGDTLSQAITDIRGRLLHADQRRDQVCVEAVAAQTSQLDVQLGDKAPITRLAFDANPNPNTVCADLTPVMDAGKQVLRLHLQKGSLALRDVQVFDHVQSGGVYDEQGKALALRGSVRAMNRVFLAKPAPARCKL
jgi:hypothetical protein